MTTNPIRPPSPPSPDSSKDSKADGKKFREELQKVEKAREVDPDEEKKKKNRQLAAQFGDNEAPDDLGGAALLPSPFDVSFYSSGASSKIPSSRQTALPSVNMDAAELSSPAPVPSPAYSPAPTVQAPAPYSPAPAPANISAPLPSSPVFWQSVDTSNNTSSTSSDNFSEYDRTTNLRPPVQQNNNSDQDDNTDNEDYEYVYAPQGETPPEKLPGRQPPVDSTKKVFSRLGQEEGPGEEVLVQGKPVKKTETPTAGAFSEKQGKTAAPGEKSAAPGQQTNAAAPSPSKSASSPAQQTAAPAPTSAAPSAPTGDAENVAVPGATSPAPQQNLASTQQKTETATPTVRPVGEKTAPVSSISDTQTDSSKQDQGEKKGGAQTASASIIPLFPTDVQPMVQAAATQAAPYLSPDTMALFQQMVGTIYVMNSRTGISTTEVLLNSPAFANSKFFGSTITIEKYATAPDALNIRLSGSTEAVNAFNQNLPSLMAAFEQNKFQFKVRIETAYKMDKVDRPVFQRKDKGDGKGSSKEGRK